MRLTHPDGSTVHLAYCTNVHPAEDLDGILAQLASFAAAVRTQLGWPVLGVGLWLAHGTARELAQDPPSRMRLRDALRQLQLEVVTVNAFPYRSFHAPVVKGAVYRPDWADPARADYTIDVATVLADLLPDDVTSGSVSTLPLAWRDGWDSSKAARCGEQLARVAHALDLLEHRTGKDIRIGLEPEPGCTVETTAQAVEAIGGLDAGRVGLCLDMAHLAVQFEDPRAAVAAAADAGAGVVKSQLSCALRAVDPSEAETRVALSEFDEPRFLHQTRMTHAHGVAGVDDLGQALQGGLAASGEWRVHYHSAIHTPGAGLLATTQDVLVEGLAALMDGPHPATRHLEVETYTWDVLPPRERPSSDEELVAGLAQELRWATDRLLELGLKEMT